MKIDHNANQLPLIILFFYLATVSKRAFFSLIQYFFNHLPHNLEYWNLQNGDLLSSCMLSSTDITLSNNTSNCSKAFQFIGEKNSK